MDSRENTDRISRCEVAVITDRATARGGGHLSHVWYSSKESSFVRARRRSIAAIWPVEGSGERCISGVSRAYFWRISGVSRAYLTRLLGRELARVVDEVLLGEQLELVEDDEHAELDDRETLRGASR